MKRLTLVVTGADLSIVRLDPWETLPGWIDVAAGPFISVTRTADEVSIVCPTPVLPDEIRAERGWRAIKVQGPLEFSLVGILVSLLSPLSMAGISVFTLSTYDTDYVLVRSSELSRALVVLAADFDIVQDEAGS
jgi:hypothetical protein